MKKEDTLTAEVLGLSPTGDGICKCDNKVIFVPLAIPGQIIRGKITKRKRKVFFGEIQHIDQKSPHEVSPFDPEFPHHGGAPWQCIAYSEQLKWKQKFVQDAFERIGKIPFPSIDPIVPSPDLTRYRNKMEFSFGYSRMRTETNESGLKTHFDEDPGLGLHKRGNWREIVRVTDTCLTSERMMSLKKTLETFALASSEPVWNPIRKEGFWRHVTIRESQRTGEILIEIQVAQEKPSSFWEKLLHFLHTEGGMDGVVGIVITSYSGVSVAGPDAPFQVISGRGHYFETFCGLTFSISHNAFFQVNTPSAELLIDTLSEFAGLTGDEDVLDLFCGTGTLGLSLARKAQSITGIEVVSSAVADAKENAKRNDISNTSFFAGSVESVLHDTLEKATFDAVIVDPPRAGLPKKARKTLASISAKKLLFVSCNPATLGRDLSEILPFGWEIERIRPHDLFPHTPHVETVAVLNQLRITNV